MIVSANPNEVVERHVQLPENRVHTSQRKTVLLPVIRIIYAISND